MIDSRELRNAFGHFGTGVAVITVPNGDNSALGLTVNSFASVSLEPPMLSWCLGRQSDLAEIFSTAENFTVNILAADQRDLSDEMARPSGHALTPAQFTIGAAGGILLNGALAQFECHLLNRVDAGDHIILIGGIDAVAYCTKARAPLIYFRGSYSGLKEDTA